MTKPTKEFAMIEKGIAITNYRGRGHRRSIYPFMEMEIGDSFLDNNCTCSADSKAYQSAKKYQQRSGNRKFVDASVEGGVRIWRIE